MKTDWEKECEAAETNWEDNPYYKKCKYCNAKLDHGGRWLNKWNKHYSCGTSVHGTGNYVEYIKKCISIRDIRYDKLKKLNETTLSNIS